MLTDKNIFKISLLGEHQNTNAALAVGIIQALRARGFSVDQAAVKKGLAGTFWPLRFEIVGKNPAIVLDAAHNPQSCQKLAETIKKIFPSQKVILIFGSSYDKDIRGMAPHLQAISQKVILTRARHPRALGWTQKLAKEIFQKEDFIITASVKEACSQALRLAGKKSVIVVTGSLFVAAEARKIL
jgi:dihydrofolate synthase/folylpolyglutamate synthase